METCKICGGSTVLLEDMQLKLTYALCEKCGFIYKNKDYHLQLNEEHKLYLNHNNNLESEGYVKIFADLIDKQIKPLNISGKILDFGSGPGPVLKLLLERVGYQVYDFDPFFNNNSEYLDNKYQLITTTEVAEHFTDPIKEFGHLVSLLEENGYLLVMTKLRKMPIPIFLDWWYRRDETHIAFYTDQSFEILASQFDLKVVYSNHENIVLLQK